MAQETPVLDKDQLESLRLEAQAVSPEKKKEFNEIIKDSHDRFIRKFGKYLDRSIETTNIEDRFILTDAETNEEFQSIWGVDPNKRVHQYQEGAGVFRAYGSDGAFVIGVPIDVWDKLNAENRDGIVEEFGSEEAAKKFVDKAMQQNIVLHEMTHIYQPGGEKPNIPLWLHEAQAYWVGRELIDEDTQVHAEEYDKKADFFQTLLDRYGDDVHELCFSKDKGHNRYLTYRINQEFTSEIQQDIFPEYKIIDPL